jgi:hypothetical protein
MPFQVERWFLDGGLPEVGYDGRAAVAARGPICRVRLLLVEGRIAAARSELARARDLAEGDRATMEEIDILRRALR